MIQKIKPVILLILIVCLSCQAVYSQSHTTYNNYTGNWETPSSWDPAWDPPQTAGISAIITINGYISCNTSISFSSSFNKLVIGDTLVIYGNLTLGNSSSLYVNNGGILIIHGNLISGNESEIVSNVNSYLIVTGNFVKNGDVNLGAFYANNNPSNVFIGGSVTSGLHQYQFPVFNCPGLHPYANSHCSYGNMPDLSNDPIYPFFMSTGSQQVPTITASGPLSFCSGNSVKLTSSEGISYLWSTGAATKSIIVTESGSYTVRVTDSNGYFSRPSEAVVVDVIALPPTPVITAGGPTAFCAGGSVTLTSSPGSTYLWSTGETAKSIIAASAGNYNVQITNSSGCISAPSVNTIVTVNALPSAAANNNGPLCEGSDLILAGKPDDMLTYSWTGPNGFTSLMQNPPVSAHATPDMAGNYTLTVTNSNGCLNSASTKVVVNKLPVVNAGADATIPYGTNTIIDATVTGTGPFVYSWSPSEKLENALTEDPKTVNLLTSTLFILTATSKTTSCSNTNDVMISVSGGVLSSSPTASPGIICAGETVQLRAIASGGTGSYAYSWSSAPAGFTSSAADPVVNPSVNTTYTVEVSDGISIKSSQVSVIVNSLPATPNISTSGPATFCEGGILTLTSNSGTGYLWSTGEASQSINVAITGSYTVKITNSDGCWSAESSPIEVNVDALPVTPTITADGPTTFCAGGSVNLTSSAGKSYLWSNGAITPEINVAAPGNYTVRVTNASGCQSEASTATIVTVNDRPVKPSITASGPTTFCYGSSITLTSSPGSTYLWSTGSTSSGINVTATGSYSVQVTNANGCQSEASAATSITVNSLPVTPTITPGGTTSFCAGGSLALTSSSGTDYLWSNGATTASINVTTPGFYTVQVTDANGCHSAMSKAAVVNVNALPLTPTITAAGPTAICAGGTVTLSSSPGSSYLWSTGATLSSINVTETGSYTVHVTDANGCRSALSQAVTVTVNDLPVATAYNNGPVFTGKALNLTGGPADMTIYSWTGPNGFTSNSQSPPVSAKATAFMAGTYTLEVTDISGCSNTASTTVEIKESPLPSVITPNGDGKNDYFVIGEITDKVELVIFNRWGNEEYINKDYKNDWDGKNKKGDVLPEDTYFYVISLENGLTRKGTVLIVR